jgi:hypothetical protein
VVDEPVNRVGDNAAAPGGERLLSMARLTLLRRFVIVDVGREGDMSLLGEVVRYVDGVRPRVEESLGEVIRGCHMVDMGHRSCFFNLIFCLLVFFR